MLRNPNTSNLDPLETMTTAIRFVSVNWSWWGQSFLFWTWLSSIFFRNDVATFFQPSIICIVEAVLEQMANAHKEISVSFACRSVTLVFQILLWIQHVVLVGGFAANDWLFTEVHQVFAPGLNVVRPENHVWVFFNVKTILFFKKNISIFRNKAVSDGAVSFYLDHLVTTRVSKVTYGTFCTVLYDPNNPDHKARTNMAFTSDVSGKKWIRGSFNIILPKVNCISFSYCKFLPQDIVGYSSFRDERIQKFLLSRFGWIVVILWSFPINLVLSWKRRDSELERHRYWWEHHTVS